LIDEVVGVVIWVFIGLVLLYVLLGQGWGEMATGGGGFLGGIQNGEIQSGDSPQGTVPEEREEREEIQTTHKWCGYGIQNDLEWNPANDWVAMSHFWIYAWGMVQFSV
jgi:hypothetical protein